MNFNRFAFECAYEYQENCHKEQSLKERFLNFKGGGLFGGIGDLVSGVVGAVGDVVGAITGSGQTNAMEDLAQAQSQAQKAALEQQKRQQQLNQQEQNKLNAQSPQYSEDGFYDSYDTSNVFTGMSGLTADDYTLGRNSLLGTTNTNTRSR